MDTTALQPTPAQNEEPALHEVEPRRARRSEVEVEPRVLDQPVMRQGRLVRLQVVEHEMHLQIACDAALDLLQKRAELDAAMMRLATPDHRSGFHVEGGKQVECAMPAIVVRHALGPAQPGRRGKAAAVPCTALIYGFSSMHSSSARSGGAR